MFEYHGNNLKVDADGVSVTIALAEPLDIEKPLADLDLTNAKPIDARQQVVTTWNIKELKQDLASGEDEGTDEDVSWDDFAWMRRYPIYGFNPSGIEPRQYSYDEYEDSYEIGGGGNNEVLSRVVPFLEIGVRGLLAWCVQESQVLKEFKEKAAVRSEEVTVERGIRLEAEKKAKKEREEAEAAELERIMPRRSRAIAQDELNQFARKLGLNYDFTQWKEIDDKKLGLFLDTHGVIYDDCEGPAAIILNQETPIEKYNGNLGEVTVSKRGYFVAGKKTGLHLVFGNRAGDCKDFPTIQEALESLIPYVLEGEEDFSWNAGPTPPGLPLPPEN